MSRWFVSCIVVAIACQILAARANAQVGAAVPVAQGGETHLIPAKLPQITPPTLADEVTVLKLPAAVKATAVGGGGRYLIFHLGELRKLAIFDVNAGKVTQY